MMEIYYIIFFILCMGLWGLVLKKEFLSMMLSYLLTVFSLSILMLFISFDLDNKKGYFFAIILAITVLIEVVIGLVLCKKIRSFHGSLVKKI